MSTVIDDRKITIYKKRSPILSQQKKTTKKQQRKERKRVCTPGTVQEIKNKKSHNVTGGIG
jgi:hypothetical protein